MQQGLFVIITSLLAPKASLLLSNIWTSVSNSANLALALYSSSLLMSSSAILELI
jgi:hypothetical protein